MIPVFRIRLSINVPVSVPTLLLVLVLAIPMMVKKVMKEMVLILFRFIECLRRLLAHLLQVIAAGLLIRMVILLTSQKNLVVNLTLPKIIFVLLILFLQL